MFFRHLSVSRFARVFALPHIPSHASTRYASSRASTTPPHTRTSTEVSSSSLSSSPPASSSSSGAAGSTKPHGSSLRHASESSAEMLGSSKKKHHAALAGQPLITVVGVGGAGGNAVNNMITAGLQGVDFLVVNTDAQALQQSKCENRIQLGPDTTMGLGAGARPEVGRQAVDEVLDEIIERIRGSNMVFVTAGMGGGTGTGAAPAIAEAARELGILTVGVVTKPFLFEGRHRMRVAEAGIRELEEVVDTLLVIPNQNLFKLADPKTTFADAFKLADEVLYHGVRSVTDLIVMPGLINLDFADVRTTMTSAGRALMGTGEADGPERAAKAAERALTNPLLGNIAVSDATGVLLSICGGDDMTLFEVDEIANRIREEVMDDANIIFGSTFDSELSGRIRVSIIITGVIDTNDPHSAINRSRKTSSTVEESKAPEGATEHPFLKKQSARTDGLTSNTNDNMISPSFPSPTPVKAVTEGVLSSTSGNVADSDTKLRDVPSTVLTSESNVLKKNTSKKEEPKKWSFMDLIRRNF